MKTRQQVDEEFRTFRRAVMERVEELCKTRVKDANGQGIKAQNFAGTWKALLAAGNVEEIADCLRNQLQPLVASNRAHYKGYCDKDYIDLVIRSQLGSRPSLRGAAHGRYMDSIAVDAASPAPSTMYNRLLYDKDESDVRTIGSLLATLHVIAYALISNQWNYWLIFDEYDESSSSAGPIRGQKATTESGRSLQMRKRARKLAKETEARFRYDAFLHHDFAGHEYMALIAVFPDGRRFGLEAYPNKDQHLAPAAFLESVQVIAKRLEALGLALNALLLDRRWTGSPPLMALEKSGINFIARQSVTGRSLNTGKASKHKRRQRRKDEGELAFTHEERARQHWPKAEAIEGYANILVKAERCAPYQVAPKLFTTIVIGYLPPRSRKIRPGEKLVYGSNMFPMFFATNLPPTHEVASQVVISYLEERWGVEQDIKEGKSYQELGSGPNFRARTLTLQVSMILQNFATFLWSVSRLRCWRARYVRYVYNALLRRFFIDEAIASGWKAGASGSLSPAPSD